MVFCSKCGAVVDGMTFCATCGEKVPSQAEQLVGVTDAVRHYAASASQEEKDKKYGQQQWGLFETNYQRKKAISTEESLQEIEKFAAEGVTYKVSPSGAPYGAAGAAGAAPGAGSAGFGAGSAASGPGSAGFGAGPRVGGSSVEFDQRGRPGAGSGQFPAGSQAGASYFSQHQQKEAAKFKPGYQGGVKLDQ